MSQNSQVSVFRCIYVAFIFQILRVFYRTPVDARVLATRTAAGGPPHTTVAQARSSTHELAAEVRYAQACVHVRLTHTAAFLLLPPLAFLPLTAATARLRRGGLRIIEVERRRTISAAT